MMTEPAAKSCRLSLFRQKERPAQLFAAPIFHHDLYRHLTGCPGKPGFIKHPAGASGHSLPGAVAWFLGLCPDSRSPPSQHDVSRAGPRSPGTGRRFPWHSLSLEAIPQYFVSGSRARDRCRRITMLPDASHQDELPLTGSSSYTFVYLQDCLLPPRSGLRSGPRRCGDLVLQRSWTQQ